jgi:hypothetical protein
MITLIFINDNTCVCVCHFPEPEHMKFSMTYFCAAVMERRFMKQFSTSETFVGLFPTKILTLHLTPCNSPGG